MKINEMFSSIQGEGKLIGMPTYFIRSVGCNLECAWCDTRYAFSEGREMSIDEIMATVPKEHDVCLTGGEPLIQNEFSELLNRLLAAGKRVSIETNGSVSLKDIPKDGNVLISMDIKCPSSGMSDKMDYDNIEMLGSKDQLKFVINDDVDFEFAAGILEKYQPNTEVIFSPVGGMAIKPLVERVLEKGLDVRVLPQLHKIIWGDKKGV